MDASDGRATATARRKRLRHWIANSAGDPTNDTSTEHKKKSMPRLPGSSAGRAADRMCYPMGLGLRNTLYYYVCDCVCVCESGDSPRRNMNACRTYPLAKHTHTRVLRVSGSRYEREPADRPTTSREQHNGCALCTTVHMCVCSSFVGRPPPRLRRLRRLVTNGGKLSHTHAHRVYTFRVCCRIASGSRKFSHNTHTTLVEMMCVYDYGSM